MFLFLHLYRIPVCLRSKSGFVSLHTNSDPPFIIGIRIPGSASLLWHFLTCKTAGNIPNDWADSKVKPTSAWGSPGSWRWHCRAWGRRPPLPPPAQSSAASPVWPSLPGRRPAAPPAGRSVWPPRRPRTPCRRRAPWWRHRPGWC